MSHKNYFPILNALPQTQCMRCGYDNCAAYALAVCVEKAPINQCAPGGQEGVQRLSQITGLPELVLSPQYGVEKQRTVVWIDEDWCIGCTRCIKVCPVDAIVGSNKVMHTVIEEFCTGCELCLDECPVDCMVAQVVTEETGWQAWSAELANQSRKRYENKKQRLQQLEIANKLSKKSSKFSLLSEQENKKLDSSSIGQTILDKKQLIKSLMEKARQARVQHQLETKE